MHRSTRATTKGKGGDPLHEFQSRQQHAYLAAAIGVMLVTAIAYLQAAPESASVSDDLLASGAPVMPADASDQTSSLAAAATVATVATTPGTLVPPTFRGSSTRPSAPSRVAMARVSTSTSSTVPSTTTTTTITLRTVSTFTTAPKVTAAPERPVPVAVLVAARRPEPATPPSSLEVTKSTMIAAPPPVVAVVPSPTKPSSSSSTESGLASWYGAPHGTCAHKTLPIGTVLKVTRLSNGVTVSCRVSDRGPYIDRRIVDLSKDTYSVLAPSGSGVIDVTTEW